VQIRMRETGKPQIRIVFLRASCCKLYIKRHE